MATMSTLSRKLRELEQRMRQRRPERWATATHAGNGGPVLTVAGVDEARRIARDDGRGLLVIVDPNLEPGDAA